MIDLNDFTFKKVENGYSVIEYLGACEKLIIPDTFKGEPVVEIGLSMIYNNLSPGFIKEIVLPKDLLVINESAFDGCTNLEIIELPDKLMEIKDFAFSDCSSLEEIVFPESLQSVGEFAFSFCFSLKKAIAKSKNTKFFINSFQEENSLNDVSFSILICLPIAIQIGMFTDLILKFDTLPVDEQDEITAYLQDNFILRKELFFDGNINIINFLLDLNVNISLDTLDEYLEFSIDKKYTILTAYLIDYKNKNYTQSEINNQDERKEKIDIGFQRPNLDELKEKWVVKIDGKSIIITGYHGKSTTQTLPSSLEDGTPILGIQPGDNSNFNTLKKLRLCDGLEVIGDKTFCETFIQEINIPSTVKEIGEQAFSETFITEIALPDTLTSVSAGLFWCCENLEKVVLPPTITEICSNAFNGCFVLTQINFPSGLTNIGEGAFYRCHKLKDITLPDSVNFIGPCAFSDCYDLEEIRLPKGLTSLKKSVFLNCYNLKKVIVQNPDIEIDPNVFENCDALEFIGIEGEKNWLEEFEEYGG